MLKGRRSQQGIWLDTGLVRPLEGVEREKIQFAVRNNDPMGFSVSLPDGLDKDRVKLLGRIGGRLQCPDLFEVVFCESLNMSPTRTERCHPGAATRNRQAK